MPNIKRNSRQYLFKKKLNIRGKSRIELIKESFFMMIVGLFLLLINYFIPRKIELFNSFKNNAMGILNNLLQITYYSLEILIVLIICTSLLISIFLIIGSINRIVKLLVSKSRSRKIRFR
tara:strand:- start:57 stop:416 length:360 start_codon:yes stop_codon:yes gene_type:complete